MILYEMLFVLFNFIQVTHVYMHALFVDTSTVTNTPGGTGRYARDLALVLSRRFCVRVNTGCWHPQHERGISGEGFQERTGITESFRRIWPETDPIYGQIILSFPIIFYPRTGRIPQR